MLDDKFMSYTVKAKKTIADAQNNDILSAPEYDDLPLNNPSVLKQFIEESKRHTFIDQINELIGDDFDDDIEVNNG